MPFSRALAQSGRKRINQNLSSARWFHFLLIHVELYLQVKFVVFILSLFDWFWFEQQCSVARMLHWIRKKISQDVDWLVYVTDVWRPFTTLFPTKCATRGDISGAYSLSPEVNPSRHARFSPDDCQCQFFCLYSLIIYLRAFFSFERRYRKIYTYFMIYVFPFRRIYSSLQIFQIFQTFRLLYPQAFFCISCTWTIRNYESNPLFILSR